MATTKCTNIYFPKYVCPSRRDSLYYDYDDLEAIRTKAVGLETIFVGCDTVFKEIMNASRSSEHSRVRGEKMSGLN